MVLLNNVFPFFRMKSTPPKTANRVNSNPVMTSRSSSPSFTFPVPAKDLKDSPESKKIVIKASFFIIQEYDIVSQR